jgi:hypothetical protein
MDPLFHFVMSFAGGYILLRGLKAKFRWRDLFLLSVLAGLMDIDHFTGLGNNLIFHNLAFIIGFPLLLMVIFRHLKHEKMFFYSLALMVMMLGQLPFDMLEGLYGVPLLFPFSGELYMIPFNWNLFDIGNSYVISRTGIAAAIYFGIVFSILLVNKITNSKNR